MSDNKARLRAELFKCAARGEFPTYGDMLKHLKPRITGGWRPEWTADLNQIAMEERSHGYPDITFISCAEKIIFQAKLSLEKLIRRMTIRSRQL